MLLRAYALEFAGEEDVTLAAQGAARSTAIAGHDRRRASPPSSRRTGVPEARAAARRGSWPRTCPEADLPGLYTAADAYVSPTRGEGWGRPLMEALACGAPVDRLALERAAGVPRRRQRQRSSTARSSTSRDDVDIAVFRGQRWFDPDVDALRAAMRAVAATPRGARARARPPGPRLLERVLARRDRRAHRRARPSRCSDRAARLHHRRAQLPRAGPHARRLVPGAPPRGPLHRARDRRSVRRLPAAGRRLRDARSDARSAWRRASWSGCVRCTTSSSSRRRPSRSCCARCWRATAARSRTSTPTSWSSRALDEIDELARGTGIVLTPHTTEPHAARRPAPHGAGDRAGGHLQPRLRGRRRGGRPFLDWWCERLARDCIVAVESGPLRRPEVGRLRARLLGLRDPARRRLQRRVLEPPASRASRRPATATWSTGGRCASSTTAATRPRGPRYLSKFQSERAASSFAELPQLRELCDHYAARLAATGSPSAARCRTPSTRPAASC